MSSKRREVDRGAASASATVEEKMPALGEVHIQRRPPRPKVRTAAEEKVATVKGILKAHGASGGPQRATLLELCTELVTKYPHLALKCDAVYPLWKCEYDHIEACRSQLAAFAQGAEVSGKYAKAVEAMERALREAKTVMSDLYRQLMPFGNISEGRELLYRCTIYLGDIERYREMKSDQTTSAAKRYREAEALYSQAIRLCPGLGSAYNQRAVLATYRYDYMEAIYYYIRAIQASSKGFLKSVPNLQHVVSLARKKPEDAFENYMYDEYVGAVCQLLEYIVLGHTVKEVEGVKIVDDHIIPAFKMYATSRQIPPGDPFFLKQVVVFLYFSSQCKPSYSAVMLHALSEFCRALFECVTLPEVCSDVIGAIVMLLRWFHGAPGTPDVGLFNVRLLLKGLNTSIAKLREDTEALWEQDRAAPEASNHHLVSKREHAESKRMKASKASRRGTSGDEEEAGDYAELCNSALPEDREVEGWLPCVQLSASVNDDLRDSRLPAELLYRVRLHRLRAQLKMPIFAGKAAPRVSSTEAGRTDPAMSAPVSSHVDPVPSASVLASMHNDVADQTTTREYNHVSAAVVDSLFDDDEFDKLLGTGGVATPTTPSNPVPSTPPRPTSGSGVRAPSSVASSPATPAKQAERFPLPPGMEEGAASATAGRAPFGPYRNIGAGNFQARSPATPCTQASYDTDSDDEGDDIVLTPTKPSYY